MDLDESPMSIHEDEVPEDHVDPQAAIIKKIVEAFKELLDCAKPPPSIVPNVTVNFDVQKIVDAIKETAGSTPRIRPG